MISIMWKCNAFPAQQGVPSRVHLVVGCYNNVLLFSMSLWIFVVIKHPALAFFKTIFFRDYAKLKAVSKYGMPLYQLVLIWNNWRALTCISLLFIDQCRMRKWLLDSARSQSACRKVGEAGVPDTHYFQKTTWAIPLENYRRGPWK